MRVFFAILCSIVFHGVVAILLALAIKEFSKDSATVEVSLDLSQVELSFSENEADLEPPLPIPPSPSIEEVRPEEAPPPELNAAEEKIESFPPSVGDVEMPRLPDMPPMKMDIPPKKESARAPRQAKIDVPPKPVETIRPEYPRQSRLNKEEGVVSLLLRIDENGNVASADIEKSSGFSALDAAAKKAVLNARFNPAKSGSESVAATALISLKFTLK